MQLPHNMSKTYPNNIVEEKAYKTQFNYLKRIGYKTIDQILKIPTMRHKVEYKTIFKKWWNEI